MGKELRSDGAAINATSTSSDCTASVLPDSFNNRDGEKAGAAASASWGTRIAGRHPARAGLRDLPN